MRVGLMEEVGLFPGSMKLASDGGSPHSSVSSGVEKSDISLLKMMPVRVPRLLDPNLKIKKWKKVAFATTRKPVQKFFIGRIGKLREGSTEECITPC